MAAMPARSWTAVVDGLAELCQWFDGLLGQVPPTFKNTVLKYIYVLFEQTG
jgi:hypothetical protein